MEEQERKSNVNYDLNNVFKYNKELENEKKTNETENPEQKSEQKPEREVLERRKYWSSHRQENNLQNAGEEQKENIKDNPEATEASLQTTEKKERSFAQPSEKKEHFDINKSSESAYDELMEYKSGKKEKDSNISLKLQIDHEQLTNEIAEILQQTVSTELENVVINTVNDNLQSFSDTKEWANNVVKALEQIQEHAEIEKSKFKEWIKKENRVTILSLIAIGILFFSGFISGWCLKGKFTTYQQLIANAYNKALQCELDSKWKAEQEHVREEAEKIIENARKKSEKLIEDASKKSTELQAQELKNEVHERTKNK